MRADDQYFCSGVMVINKFLWKEKGLTESSIALAMKEPEKCKNYDQTVLNFLLHGMVNIVDESWGWNHWRFAEMPEGPVILHYITGGKPWRVPLEYGSRGLWLKAYERLCGDVFPWNRRQMILKAKVNALEKSLHGATTFGFPGRVVEMLSRKKFQEWKWSGEKARQEKTGMCLGNLERALERLDSQIENNRERQEFANF
jgi:lipopolysaccharide biosynthesis glycosyltransferase